MLDKNTSIEDLSILSWKDKRFSIVYLSLAVDGISLERKTDTLRLYKSHGNILYLNGILLPSQDRLLWRTEFLF